MVWIVKGLLVFALFQVIVTPLNRSTRQIVIFKIVSLLIKIKGAFG